MKTLANDFMKHFSNNAKLICPKCLVPLNIDTRGFICNSCHDIWKIEKGVIKSPNFDDKQYWGEILKAQMHHILWRAKVLGAAKAFEEWAGNTNNRYMERYVLDWRRAALLFELVNLPNRPIILDYGCGYGTIGLSIAKMSDTVYLTDSTIERIEFAGLRAKETGISSVIPLGIQDWRHLPIPPKSVDFIIVNGVLEWIPTTSPGNPIEVQKHFIKRLGEYLKPGGTLYIGIENRYALRYFAGYPDDHTNLHFTSIMPRWLADIYCKVRLGKSYRTITWSLAEYKRNLVNLGFKTSVIYCMYPDYRFPEAACRIDDHMALAKIHDQLVRGKSFSKRIKRKILAIISNFRLWPWFVCSFGIVATKGK